MRRSPRGGGLGGVAQPLGHLGSSGPGAGGLYFGFRLTALLPSLVLVSLFTLVCVGRHSCQLTSSDEMKGKSDRPLIGLTVDN